MGAGKNKAAEAANAANTEQQRQIQQTVAQINAAYSTPQRQAQYDTYGKNLTDYYTGQVKEQEATNARNLNFAMARSGLTGGSASVDANTQLQKDFSKGLIQASQQAQGGRAALEQSDIQAKNQLVGLAQQGNFTGSIPQQIAATQSAALGAAKNYGNANALGNLFAGTGQIWQNEQTAAANRRAQVSPIGSLYGPSGFSTGGTAGGY